MRGMSAAGARSWCNARMQAHRGAGQCSGVQHVRRPALPTVVIVAILQSGCGGDWLGLSVQHSGRWWDSGGLAMSRKHTVGSCGAAVQMGAPGGQGPDGSAVAAAAAAAAAATAAAAAQSRGGRAPRGTALLHKVQQTRTTRFGERF